MSFRSPFPCRLFLFDLDGTLIDSMADIAYSVSRALDRMGLRRIPGNQVAGFVGEGVQKLIQRALRWATGTEATEKEIRTGVALYLEEYGNHLLDSTRLYPGAREALDHLRWASLGVVTNKPERFSSQILEGLGVRDRFCVIVGGDTTPQRKPEPAPLREAMNRCGVPPLETVMVGDSSVDVEAGRSAGVVTCGISGGFRGREELEAARCDLIIESIAELPLHFCPPV